MVEITQSALDEMCENFEEMNFKAGAWWPTEEEINTKIAPFIKERLTFAIWITETASEPQTDEEKAAKKLLLRLIYENLNVTEDEPC